MKIKLDTLLNMGSAVRKLSQAKLPIRTAFRVAKFLPLFDAEVATFQKLNGTLLEKHGADMSSGMPRFKEQDKGKAYSDELKVLLDTETEIELPKLTLDDLEGADLTAGDLYALSDMVIVEPEKAPA